MTKEQVRESLAGMVGVCETEQDAIFDRLWANKYVTDSEKQVDMFRHWRNHGLLQGLRITLFYLSQLDSCNAPRK